MAAFSYLAQNQAGATVSGRVVAKDIDDAIRDLQVHGVLVLTITQEAELQGGTPGLGFFRRAPGDRHFLNLGRDLSMLMRGGVPILRALRMLAGKSVSPPLALALSRCSESVASGRSLHAAFAEHPGVFSPLLVTLARVGEESGQLPATLGHYADYMERRLELRRKVLAAVTYPVIVVVFAAFVVILLCVKVVPTFAGVFKSFDMALPPMTRAVVGLSGLLIDEWPLLSAFAAGFVLLFNLYLSTEEGRERRARILIDAPVFGLMVRDSLQEKFFSTLSLLIHSGVSLLTALQNLQGLYADMPPYQKAIDAACQHIAKGSSISNALKQTGIFEPTDVESVEISEETGQVAETLGVLGRYHAERLDVWTRQLSTVLEPVMVIVIGGLVGFIMLSLFIPMLEMTNIKIK